MRRGNAANAALLLVKCINKNRLIKAKQQIKGYWLQLSYWLQLAGWLLAAGSGWLAGCWLRLAGLGQMVWDGRGGGTAQRVSCQMRRRAYGYVKCGA